MLCKKPYMQGILPFGCGQCLPCRINRRRLWSHRILLESMLHGDSSFVTLTYAGNLPGVGSILHHADVQKFLKRLRWRWKKKLRYFLVGEYGDSSKRSHYHLALFGYPSCPYGNYSRCTLKYCSVCRLIEDCWGLGFVSCGELSADSAAYVTGYVTKKLTKKETERLNGRPPEYARMSLKPGIAADAMSNVADVLTSHLGSKHFDRNVDVPMALKHGDKSMPLGKYLRRKLREKIGDEELLKKMSLQEFGKKMREVLEDARLAQKTPEYKDPRTLLIDSNKQRVVNLETRTKIYSKKGDL